MKIAVQLQKAAVALVRIIPLKLADKVAEKLALVFCSLSEKRRGHIERNLQHIFFDENLSQSQINKLIKSTFVNYARTMVDFLRLNFMSERDFSVDGCGYEHFPQALKHNRGCIMLTLHIGNWDFAGAYLASIGVPMNALVEETEPEMFDLYTRHRERFGMKTFPLSKAGYAFLHTIKNNRVLAVLGDRDILKNGITVDFFSGERNIPRGLGDIIVKRKIPVVFGYLVLNAPDKEKRYLGVCGPPMFFEKSPEEFNKAMVKKFEECIRRFPDQWMLFESDWVA
jgi:KDO2-lipid IV(A) lauroyltransferase